MATDMLIEQLGYNQGVLKINLTDLSQEDSLIAPTRGGNCINWIVGHVVHTRGAMLKLLSKEPIWDDERSASYKRGSKQLAPENAMDLADIMRDFDTAQETIVEALKGLSAEDLAAKSPMSFFKGEDETVGSAMAAFVFHETYHIGQTGLLRRVAGKEGGIK